MFATITLPDSFSWREKLGNNISPVRDQGQCGDCWAQSSVSTLADRYAAKHNIQAPDLSVLWLVSNINYYLDATNTKPYSCEGNSIYNPISFFNEIGCKLNECWPMNIIDQNFDNFPKALMTRNQNTCSDDFPGPSIPNTIYKSGRPIFLYDDDYNECINS